MATINVEKIGSVASLAAGATYHFQWKNPPWSTVLSYFAYPVPRTPTGPHGSSTGTMTITKVECTWDRDHDNTERRHAGIYILSSGNAETGFDHYQSWIS